MSARLWREVIIESPVTPDPTTPIPTLIAQARDFRRSLLAWYRTHQRDLPWRAKDGQRPDPYHTLVSEAMLQQTQVATVIPYFHRFIEAFTNIHALADASEQQVLALWQGLGYYRRARNLHAAAKMIVSDFAGQVPSTVEDLLRLPGVGQYTAGAIASIAYNTQAAIVDGNVERVFARLLHLTDPINAPATKKKLWAIAEDLVPKSKPGDYNQALMELGATVCTPKLPKCFICPVREHCQAVQRTNPETLPIKLTKKKPKAVTHVVLAVERSGKFLFEQRPSDGLWSNMWQLPTWEEPLQNYEDSRRVTRGGRADENSSDSTPPCYAAATPTALTDWFHARFKLTLNTPQPLADFTHQTTHRTIRFIVLHASIASGRLKPNSGVWRKLDQVHDLPMSNPQRQAIEQIIDS